ncbi:MAG: MBL fold metallo-hydrolase [Planctomycetota bacterium]|nr:MBL fold metallo-hydrolase [Planctomycetota bacterium]
MRSLVLSISGIALLALSAGGRVETWTQTTGPGPNRIINLYDAFGEKREGTVLDFGFSCLIVHEGKRIPFDGGTNADLLARNAKALGIDLSQVDFAVGSHAHGDHLNGFDYLLSVNPKVKIYLPQDFYCGAAVTVKTPEGTLEQVPPTQRYYGKTDRAIPVVQSGRFWKANVEYVSEGKEIAPGLKLVFSRSPHLGYFTAYPPNEEKPKLTGLPELSLSLETEACQVLVVGCSHSSVGKIVEDARKQVGGEIDLVYGGYHLLPYDEATIRKVATEMRDEHGVKRAAPCHCTGPLGFKVFAEIYGEGFELAGLGAEVAISK